MYAIRSYYENGDILALDALHNQVIINPSDAQLAQLKDAQAKFLAEKAELAKLKDLTAVTQDGHAVELCANIGSLKDMDSYNFV